MFNEKFWKVYNQLVDEKVPGYMQKVREGIEQKEALRRLGEEVWEEIYKIYGVRPVFEGG